MKNILYIEDNPDNLLLVKRVLTSHGYHVLEARNGFEGLSVAQREDVDLILLDRIPWCAVGAADVPADLHVVKWQLGLAEIGAAISRGFAGQAHQNLACCVAAFLWIVTS